MEFDTVFAFIFLSLIYGLAILALIPESFAKKFSHAPGFHFSPFSKPKKSLVGPVFFSFVLGYFLAAIMVYFYL
ncbi:hypothetical protein A3SI_09772 [Nitritalea halalkaliphila LW7]|uniref:Uncharacterized protein n=1 Tax=Nitritalea halalkaliphila LW7 TaxID=1189621 RepID=I5C3S6_9BACT|nr:hypothetical protein A3SI_09772 [Nitritalea halalkaliphila LW7]